MIEKPFASYYENEMIRESAKTLRTNIEFSGIDKPIQSVVITSAEKFEGKSTVAIYLAIAYSEAGKNTLIIDNDFRNPQMANRCSIRSNYSLSDVLSATSENITDFCIPTKLPRLSVMDIGNRRISNPIEMLSSAKYKQVLQYAIQAFDFVIVDTPPLGLFIDAAVISSAVDGVIVTIGSGKTKSSQVKEVLSQLDKAKASVIGAVLNDTKASNTSYYYYYDKQNHTKKKKQSGNRPRAY